MELTTEARQILDQETLIFLTLLILINKQKDWISIDEISKKTSYERRTIIKYLLKLQEQAEKFDSSQELIQLIKKNKVYCSFRDESQLVMFIIFIVEQSITVQLLRSIFFNDKLSRIKFSIEHYISESTFRRTIHSFRKQITPFDIQLKSKQRYYYLIGDELQVRFYAYLAFWATYQGVSWPFPISEQKIRTTLTHLLGDSFLSLDPPYQKKLCYLLAVNYHRWKLGHTPTAKNMNQSVCHTISKKYLETIESTSFLRPLNWTENEAVFFLSQLQAEAFIYTTTLGDFFTEHHQSIGSTPFSSSAIYKEELLNFYSLRLPIENVKLFDSYSLASHIHASLYKGFGGTLGGYDSAIISTSDYPYLYKEMTNFIKHLQTLHPEKNFDNEKYLLYRYVLLFSIVEKQVFFEPPIYVKFVTDQSMIVQTLVSSKINSIFSHEFNLIFLSALDTTQADISISTSVIPDLFNYLERSKATYISNELSSSDIQILHATFKKIIISKEGT